MIVVDIETSSTKFSGGITQIGAVDFENPKRQFFGECRIDNDDEVGQESLDVIGRTEKQLRSKKNKNIISQKELLKKFFAWCSKTKIKNFMCHNPQFDFAFFKTKAEKYNLELPVHFRCYDLHSMASLKYYQLEKKILVRLGHSDMGLPNIMKFCGMQDETVVHNALEDAKQTAECFSRIMYGKTLIKEYSKYKIPKYLK